jgi:hypothetical protein
MKCVALDATSRIFQMRTAVHSRFICMLRMLHPVSLACFERYDIFIQQCMASSGAEGALPAVA